MGWSLSACSESPPTATSTASSVSVQASPTSATTPPSATPLATPTASSLSGEPSPSGTLHQSAGPLTETIDFPNQLENFDAALFSEPTTIGNTWFPLKPGAQYTYEGFTEQAGQQTPHRFVLTVSDLTKVINDVPNVVVWDQDFKDGELAEAELAFFAQADNGNVWHFGQYPEVYEDGTFVEAPTWIAGIDGAQPGITIKEEPQLGGPTYSQGWSPTVPWTDRARVVQVGVENCVPQGCYQNQIVTEEFAREEPGAFQLNYYAPGVGNTRVEFTGTDQTKETLELISAIQLDPTALAEARTAILKLEESAYQRSPEIYGTTPPAEQRT